MTPEKPRKRWKWLRRAAGSVVGLALGWVVAGVVQGEGKTMATTEPAATQSEVAPAVIPAIPPPGAAATQPADTDDNLDSIVPKPGQVGWVWPLCAGIVGLFVVAAAVGIVSKSLRIKDPGETSEIKHH